MVIDIGSFLLYWNSRHGTNKSVVMYCCWYLWKVMTC